MKSVRKTSTLLIALSVGTALTLGQLTIDSVIANRLQGQFDTALLAKARALVTLTRFDGVEVELDFADEFMPEFEAVEGAEYFELFLDDGTLLERSRTFSGRAPSVFAMPAAEMSFSDTTLADGRLGRLVVIDFVPQIEDKALREQYPESSRQHAVLRVYTERESLNASLLQLHILLAVIGAIVVVASIACVIVAMRIGLRPLDTMRRQIARIDEDSIDKRLSASGQPAELEPIARQFNHVLERLEFAFHRERRFSSDVAHELRTPVAELKAFAEVGLKWPQDRDVREFFSHVYDASAHLDTVVGNLLALCRGDSGQIVVDPRPIRASQIVDAVWDGCRVAAGEKHIRLISNLWELPPFISDPAWFELIVVNILSNAIAYGTPDSDIVCGFDTGTDCTVYFTNECESLEKADLEHVFQRFWRKDVARSGGRHAGIGLALVKSYAEQLGMDVTATLIGDNQFRICLSGIQLAPAVADEASGAPVRSCS